MATGAVTYSAFYQDDHAAIIYRYKTDDGTLANLPQKARPAHDPRSTFFRQDGGDKFQFALFETNLGQLIVVQRDQKEAHNGDEGHTSSNSNLK
jgi:hypothetical protein